MRSPGPPAANGNDDPHRPAGIRLSRALRILCLPNAGAEHGDYADKNPNQGSHRNCLSFEELNCHARDGIMNGAMRL